MRSLGDFLNVGDSEAVGFPARLGQLPGSVPSTYESWEFQEVPRRPLFRGPCCTACVTDTQKCSGGLLLTGCHVYPQQTLLTDQVSGKTWPQPGSWSPVVDRSQLEVVHDSCLETLSSSVLVTLSHLAAQACLERTEIPLPQLPGCWD